ncbi:MAG: LacI family transcriptional regulator [Chloroflexi bacterium]|nr:LacI family transcriptional regulator [Chloroflexota bacterium]MCC6891974.1 LacI family DNA-binding transcriptional regulator [Anaerolineae bacterium]
MDKNNNREMVTQDDVARQAGVSRAMVSYVLNNGPRNVSAETRRRILDAIRELGYRPNQHAQRLTRGTHAARNSIGIIAGGTGANLIERPYYSTILANLFDQAQQLNQHIRFFSFFDALSDPVFFNKNIHQEEISSLVVLLPALILNQPEQERIFPQIIERIDTILCLEKSIYGLPTVILDFAGVAQLAVEHLIKLGHKRIAFLSLSDERLDGYKRTLAMYNLAFDPTIVRQVEGSNMLASAYEQTVSLIQESPDITAIFAANDEAAIAAMAALKDMGLAVPQDIAITSIDNTEAAAFVRPALTSVNVPRHKMVDYAFQFLLSQSVHRVSEPASMMLPIELVVRDSCGAKRT